MSWCYKRLELEVDEITFKKSRFTWFRHVMQMGEERIPKKMERKNRKTLNQMDKTN